MSKTKGQAPTPSSVKDDAHRQQALVYAEGVLAQTGVDQPAEALKQLV